jgi:N-hydroxyarylamine O-acetyltransferase
MTDQIDIEGYFRRIGYAGPREPSLAALHGITAAHVQSIPFENLDILLGRPILLGLGRIEQKLVVERRGGYCFEQNTLLLHVLVALGFRVTPLSARVRIQSPRDYVPPRTHMFLRIELAEGTFLADVGIGGLSVACALRLEADVSQPTPHEPRRIVRAGAWSGFEQRASDAKLYHQAYFAGDWQDVCEFTLEEMPEIDRVIGNWYTSAHPSSHFKSRLMVARATPQGRVTLANREFSVRGHDGRSETRLVASPDELLELLDEHFGLQFPAGTRFTCPGLPW